MKKEDDKITNFFERGVKKQEMKTTKSKKSIGKKKNQKNISKRNETTLGKKSIGAVLKTKKTKAVKNKSNSNKLNGNKKTINSRKRGTKHRVNTLLKREKNIKNNKTKTTKKINSKKTNFWGKLINSLLIVLIITLPFFVTRQTFQGINFEKSFYFIIFVSSVLLLNLFKSLLDREIKIQKTFLDKCMLLFVLIYGASAWFSVDRWHSLVGFFGDPSRGLIELLFAIIFFYLVLSNFSLETAKRAYWAVVWVIILISTYTLLSGLVIIPQFIQTRVPFSFIGSTVGLTVFLSMGVPLLATALLELNNNKSKKFTKLRQAGIFATLVIVVINLIMLQTFMAWSGLLSGIIILSFLILGQKTKQKARLVKSIIFTIFAILIIITGLASSSQRAVIPVLSKIGLPNEIRVGLPVTYNIIKNSLKDGTKQILLGSGPATFGYDFARFHSGGAMSILPSTLYQGDGIIAEGVPTLGLLASIIILLMVISFLFKALQSVNSKKQSKLYLIGLFSATVVWLVNALLGQIDAGTLFIGIIVLTLTTYFILENSKSKKDYYIIHLEKFSPISFLAVVLILGGIGLSVVSIAYASKFYSADKFLNQAMNNDDINKNIQDIKQAIKLNPREGVYYTKLGQAYLIAADKEAVNNQKNKTNNDKNKIKKNVVNSLNFLNQGTKLMPNDVRALRSLALTYKFIGNTKLAGKAYQQLIVLEPNGLEYYVELGDLQLINLKEDRDSKLDKAIKFYKQAIKINPRASEVYYKLALIYSQKNDTDNALNNIARAVQLTPNNKLYKFTLGIFLQNRGQEKDRANAEKIYKTLLIVNPQSIDVRTQLGALYEQTNHLDEAKAEYKKVIEIIGDKKGYQNIKQSMEKFIDNLNNGKLNINDGNRINETKKETKNTKEEDAVKQVAPDDQETTDKNEVTTKQDSDTMITITVDAEGPINVRSKGSLNGEKLTKIKTTGQFKKIGENDKWVRIIIPANNQHKEITGWVHKKFVTE